MSNYLRPHTGVTITVAASDKLATYSQGDYSVSQIVGYPNVPETEDSLFNGSGGNTTAAFTLATEVTIQAGDFGLYYETGTSPVVMDRTNRSGNGVTATALAATGTLTAAMILGGIVTSTTAAAVTATLDTGAVMDAVIDADVGDYFDWSVINTGGTNSFTVTASDGHTVVGDGVCVTATSCMYRTVKTAAATWVTYVLSSAAS
jgi:hypothetical protein